MRIAVVAGGWHYPTHFYHRMFHQHKYGGTCDLFVIGHRDPELSIVWDEKVHLLGSNMHGLGGSTQGMRGPLLDLDRRMYSHPLDKENLSKYGWQYHEAPNTVGDWGFFNQWLENNDYRKYDVILNCHDDTFIRRQDIFDQLGGNWLLLANGRYPEAPEAYVRGSFEFWKPELLEMLGGRIDLGDVTLTREGKTDTPEGLDALSAWNNTAVPLRDFMVRRGIVDKVKYLSQHYRVSPWIIEGERGYMHLRGGAPWSFEAGLKEYPLV